MELALRGYIVRWRVGLLASVLLCMLYAGICSTEVVPHTNDSAWKGLRWHPGIAVSRNAAHVRVNVGHQNLGRFQSIQHLWTYSAVSVEIAVKTVR
jgi:hypothetical protein